MKRLDQLADTQFGTNSYAGIFKGLYYHFYSNSEASRAERIIEDISKILLFKLVIDRQGSQQNSVATYLEGEGTANQVILPVLIEALPGLVSTRDYFTMGDSAIRGALAMLAPVNLRVAPAHILGDAFQAIIGPRLRGDKGQFFTPRNLVRAMVAITGIERGMKVVDPACGTGGFLAETYAYYSEHIGEPTDLKLIGVDKDQDQWRLAGSLLAISTQGQATVLNMNSLDAEKLEALSGDSNPFGADIVLANPPFGAKIGVTDKNILRQFDLGHQWTYSNHDDSWQMVDALRRSQDPQVLFVELSIRLLKEGGTLAIVLPEGIFGNRNSGYVWDYLRSRGEIIALLDCPRTTFQPSTDTKTNVLFFKKLGKVSSALTNKIHIGVAINCGHDRRGRIVNADGTPYPDDFAVLAKAYRSRDVIDEGWSQCEINDKYYLVPRYYDRSTSRKIEDLATRLDGEIVSLGTLVENGYLKITKGNEVGSDAYGTGEIPFVRTSDIANLEVNTSSGMGISEDIYKGFAKVQRLRPGNILLVVDGRYRIGRSAILTQYNVKCVVQSHLRILKVSDKAPISDFELLLLLNMPEIFHQMRNLVFVQSTLGTIGKRLLEIRLPIPRKSETWLRHVTSFKDMIEQRSRMLSELRTVISSEPEL